MPKNIIQDMVKAKVAIKGKVEQKREEEKEKKEPELEQNNDGSRYGLWFIALISVVFLLFAFSFLFSGAKITINPKIKNLILNENLNATKDSKDNLSFDLVDIEGDDYICHFFYALSDQIFLATTKTDEQLVIVDTLRIQHLHVIENLKWLIPLCKDKAFKLSGNILKSTIEYE